MDFLPEITVPLALLLILYGVFVIFYLIYSFFNVYHLLRFSTAGGATYTLIAVYGIGTITLLMLSLFAVNQYDWSVPLSVNAIFEGPNDGSFLDL